MTKTPKKPGLFWAALDDGNGNVEVALLRVEYFSGETSFEHGAFCVFVDGSTREFSMDYGLDQELVQPGRVVYMASKGWAPDQEVKLTWHGEAKAPASARNQEPEDF